MEEFDPNQDINDYKVNDLKKFASNLNLPNRSHKNKQELYEMLVEHARGGTGAAMPTAGRQSAAGQRSPRPTINLNDLAQFPTAAQVIKKGRNGEVTMVRDVSEVGSRSPSPVRAPPAGPMRPPATNGYFNPPQGYPSGQYSEDEYEEGEYTEEDENEDEDEYGQGPDGNYGEGEGREGGGGGYGGYDGDEYGDDEDYDSGEDGGEEYYDQRGPRQPPLPYSAGPRGPHPGGPQQYSVPYQRGPQQYSAGPAPHPGGPQSYPAGPTQYSAGPAAHPGGAQQYSAGPSSHPPGPSSHPPGPTPYSAGPPSGGPTPYSASRTIQNVGQNIQQAGSNIAQNVGQNIQPAGSNIAQNVQQIGSKIGQAGSNVGQQISGKLRQITSPGTCYVPPPINPPQITPGAPLKQNLNSVVSYCYDAVNDLSQLRPNSSQRKTIGQFKDFVDNQGSQTVNKVAANPAQSPNEVYTLGNSCKNIYTPLRERITKGKCYK